MSGFVTVPYPKNTTRTRLIGGNNTRISKPGGLWYPDGTGTLILSEGFESTDISSNGWFDNATIVTANDNRPGSSGTKCMQWQWTTGQNAPQGQGASRFDFTPTNSVYISYWAKYDSNFQDGNHQFHVTTTVDDHYTGLSRTHLTLYDELTYYSAGGGFRTWLAIQDALNIDTNNIGVDLTHISENRAVGGYNGQPEPNLTWDTFFANGLYYNYKIFQTSNVVLSNANKTSWHFFESYWQLNTISGNIGQPDGIVIKWIDDQLVIDRRDIYFRTNANPTMQFRTFIFAPYMSSGSSTNQTMWIDDLRVSVN